MKQKTMEIPTKSSQEIEAEKMARTIRAKLQQHLTLTKREEIFLEEEKQDTLQYDNPRYGH